MRKDQAVTRAGLLLRFLIVLIGISLLAQEPTVNIEPRASGLQNRLLPQMRVDANLVLVPVLVTDHLDRVVFGLDKEDFRVFDDKVEQQISHFAQEDLPISVVLVVDTSGSMRRKLNTARVAVGEFLKASNPEDEFALIEFADRARLVAGFTQDSGLIRDQLTFLQSRGQTSLVDAIFLAFNQMKHARHARKAIVAFSDGGDNSSRYGKNDLKRQLRESDIQVYSIAIQESPYQRNDTPEDMDGSYLLSAIANQTGGRMLMVESLNSLPDIAQKVGSELRNQYVLGYSPSTATGDGRYHQISVRLPQPKGRTKMRASFRTGYFSPLQ
jgi:VWFA-related protein